MTKSTQRTLFTLIFLLGGGYLVWVYWPSIKAWLNSLFQGQANGEMPANGEQPSWLEQLIAALKGKTDGDDTSSWIQALVDLINQNGTSDDLKEILEEYLNRNGDSKDVEELIDEAVEEIKESKERKGLLEILSGLFAGGAAADATVAAGTTVTPPFGLSKGAWAVAGSAVPLYLGLAPQAPVQIGNIGRWISTKLLGKGQLAPGTAIKVTNNKTGKSYMRGTGDYIGYCWDMYGNPIDCSTARSEIAA